MTARELIEELERLDDSLDVRVQVDEDPTNYWVTSLEVFEKGSSGYELHGEIVINISE